MLTKPGNNYIVLQGEGKKKKNSFFTLKSSSKYMEWTEGTKE